MAERNNMLGGKTEMEGVRELLGERQAIEHTFGDAELTLAYQLCKRFEALGFRGMDQLAADMVRGRTSEGGWGRDSDIRTVEAVAAKTVVQQNGNGGRE